MGRNETPMSDTIQVPRTPPEALLRSMATRYRHDFGLDADDASPMSSGFTEAERESLLRTMRQLYEEATGQGFYRFKE